MSIYVLDFVAGDAGQRARAICLSYQASNKLIPELVTPRFRAGAKDNEDDDEDDGELCFITGVAHSPVRCSDTVNNDGNINLTEEEIFSSSSSCSSSWSWKSDAAGIPCAPRDFGGCPICRSRSFSRFTI